MKPPRNLVTSSAACAVALMGLWACRSGTATICTLVGCTSGLTLDFAAALDSGTVVSVQAADSVPRTIRCGVDVSCGDKIFLADYTVAEAEVTITTPGGRQVSQQIHPTYEKSQPNGASCPPTCYQATVDLQIP